MCDTLVALAGSTAGQRAIFAKNSDRLRDEAQAVELYAGAKHVRGAELRCTYISVPQAPSTFATLLCRPWWMWGAEMGVNDQGVAIGNEAVFAKSAPNEIPALTGMDLVRLGLERGRTAADALDIMIALLETHGQGGDCARPGPQFYDNSFLIADAERAYVLETFGRRWLVEEVKNVRAISNLFTIREASRTSADLDNWLRSQGWGDDSKNDYANVIGNRAQLFTGPRRYARSTDLLCTQKGALTPVALMRILRDHGATADSSWRPTPPKGPICSHATDAEPRGQTVNSLVAELRECDSILWVTASSAACLSVFKPLFLDTAPPPPSAGHAVHDDNSFWWEHDRLQRALCVAEQIDLATLRHERDDLETKFQARIASVLGAPLDVRRRAIEACWADAMILETTWKTQLGKVMR